MAVPLKDPYSASGTARSVSKAMRRAGFLMADTSQRKWTEGVHVSRVGYSNLVNVDYYVPETLGVEANRARRREERAKILAWLASQAYPLNDTGFIVCKTA